MSLSPEENRRLFQRILHQHITASGGSFRIDAGDFWLRRKYGIDLAPRLRQAANWPSCTTLSTNSLEKSMRSGRIWSAQFGPDAPAARRSPARNAEARHWRTARLEARLIIERMMRP